MPRPRRSALARLGVPPRRSPTVPRLSRRLRRSRRACPDERRRRGAEGFDAGRDVGQRIELPDEARDFLLGPMLGSGQYLRQVLGREVRVEHQQTGEVELARSDGLEQLGKAAHEARGGDPAKRFVFREAQFVNAIAVEARAGTGTVDAAGFDLAEVPEQARQELVRATDEPSRGREQLRVGEVGRGKR
jgi:hypothetical protein